MRILLTSILVGVPAGAAGVAIGHFWDQYVIRKGWRGWHMPELTEDEKKEMGFG